MYNGDTSRGLRGGAGEMENDTVGVRDGIFYCQRERERERERERVRGDSLVEKASRKRRAQCVLEGQWFKIYANHITHIKNTHPASADSCCWTPRPTWRPPLQLLRSAAAGPA